MNETIETTACQGCGAEVRTAAWIDGEPVVQERGTLGWRPHRCPSRAAVLLRLVRMVGRYGWLGGYTHVVVLDDGEILGPECIAENYRQISHSTRHAINDGWRAVAVIALDDGPETCAHCAKEIR